MGATQFAKSIRSILGNPHINRGRGIVRHLAWQYRKVLNLFPYEQRISRSRIIAAHKRCGVSALINSQGLYNYDNMRLLQMALESGGFFFDIGANIGSYSLIASEQHNAHVFAFEPHPGTFRMLHENVNLNSRRNITLLNVAAGVRDGEVNLTDDSGSATNSIVSESNAGTIVVACRRIDSICKEHLVIPRFVKIDVEGFEYDVLSGFGQYLSSVELLVIEVNGLSKRSSHTPADIDRLIKSYNLSGPWYCDFDLKVLAPHQRMGTDGAGDCLYAGKSFLKALSAKTWKIDKP